MRAVALLRGSSWSTRLRRRRLSRLISLRRAHSNEAGGVVEARAGSGLGAAAAAAALWRAASEVWAVGSAREAPRVPGSAMEAARARAAASSAAMPPAASLVRC